ncbi:hypothetical protein N0V90_010699 [Kalmusia sp. IMI 367209]|nr:hypothetical protein N0V90_010699 [Kalmusia sp. IMI 367209]
MGRTEKSQGLAPPAIRKDIRAKQARHIVNKIIPSILASNMRARKGADESELIVNPGHLATTTGTSIQERNDDGGDEAKYIKRKGQGRRKVKVTQEDDPSTDIMIGKSRQKNRKDSVSQSLARLSLTSPSPSHPSPPIKLRIMAADTLTAAQTLIAKGRGQPNPCILNMASPLRPGGGVLTGATSQEEFLCARTTLLSSLKESFYRLPEFGGIYTHDVLAFRNHLGLGDASGELAPTERWYIDVISAGMLRFPDLEGGEEEEKRLGSKDREVVEAKMRAVLRIACLKGVRKLVLGAWGCGAYGNPVRDVAEAWRAVLLSQTDVKRKGKMNESVERWDGLQEVVFAISSAKMAGDFAAVFGSDVEVEQGSAGGSAWAEKDEVDEVAVELHEKISEMEGQIGRVWNADLKKRMNIILEGLKAQLSDREGGQGENEEESGVESGVEDAHKLRSGSEGLSDEDEADYSNDDPNGGLKLSQESTDDHTSE